MEAETLQGLLTRTCPGSCVGFRMGSWRPWCPGAAVHGCSWWAVAAAGWGRAGAGTVGCHQLVPRVPLRARPQLPAQHCLPQFRSCWGHQRERERWTGQAGAGCTSCTLPLFSCPCHCLALLQLWDSITLPEAAGVLLELCKGLQWPWLPGRACGPRQLPQVLQVWHWESSAALAGRANLQKKALCILPPLQRSFLCAFPPWTCIISSVFW